MENSGIKEGLFLEKAMIGGIGNTATLMAPESIRY